MDLDPELQQLLLSTFAAELDEQLQVVTDRLLALERGALGDAERIEAYEIVFRATHNIKGAARGVGAEAVADIAHRLESLFSRLKNRVRLLAPPLIDLCLEAVDGIRRLHAGWQPGEPLAAPLSALHESLATRLERVDGEMPGKPPAAAPPPPVAPAPDARAAAQPASSPERGEAADVVRVDLARLGGVSALAAELEVVKVEIQEHLAALRTLEARIARHTLRLRNDRPRLHGAFGEAADEAMPLIDQQIEAASALHGGGRIAHKALRTTSRRFDHLVDELNLHVRMLRMVRAGTLLMPMQRTVRDLARDLGKSVQLETTGDAVELDRAILEGIKDPLMHLLRNALDHGIETPEARAAAGKPAEGLIRLAVERVGSRIHVRVADDGAGIDPEHIARLAVERGLLDAASLRDLGREQKLDLIFLPGFSSRVEVTELSGRGVGLDVVRANVQALKGRVVVESRPGEGSRFLLDLPLTVATERGLIVRVTGEAMVIPGSAVTRVLETARDALVQVEAGTAVLLDGEPVVLRDLAEILERPRANAPGDRLSIVVVAAGWQRVALIVDEIVRDREMVVKRLARPLLAVRNVAGATLSGTGEVMMVLNPVDLVRSVSGARLNLQPAPATEIAKAQSAAHQVLVVDDSVTTRMLERNILEKNGYRVTLASDGQQAWDMLARQRFDLVVTDVEMPVMNGLELTSRIKGSEAHRDIPVIIVTSLGDEHDRRRGIEVGADGYVV
ncbi:MAG: response regulator, partial [Ectothiorhodospiraceae bacterium]|nr:response regulator [Ectothiorhodospiraceae bacterium]